MQLTRLRLAADRDRRWSDRSSMTVQLIPVGLHWMKGSEDDPSDLCAHGDFEFRIGTDVLSDGAQDRSLTLSAAALFLLRTLCMPHTSASRVGEIRQARSTVRTGGCKRSSTKVILILEHRK